jgi:hypothetical protein
MRQSANSAPQILNSWKEIAQYLGRGVRTVQRWERDLRLPVHRIGKGKRSPVYSTIAELKFWISTVEVVREPRPRMVEFPPRSAISPIEESRRLLAAAHALAQSLAKATARQQEQAEILHTRILQMRSRMK